MLRIGISIGQYWQKSRTMMIVKAATFSPDQGVASAELILRPLT